tara:strand:+ start:1599 stop:2048 length:450 start_codon:yes stop_codon:yes gene_type:complete
MNEICLFNSEFKELSRIERRSLILGLQDQIMELEQIDCPLKHHFTEGNYAREIFIKEGTVIVGKIHKHPHVNVISQGKCLVATEDGVEELEAPITFISKAGTKRVVLALSDVTWTTVHPTDETDLDKIEDEVIAKSYKELDSYNKRLEV